MDVIQEVVAERQRQDEKWGIQDHSPLEWMAILFEEVGETSEHVVETHFGRRTALDGYRTEMLQVAAVCVAAVQNLDRRRAMAASRAHKGKDRDEL